MTGDVSGDVFLGYRHVSCVSLFFSGVAGMLRLIPSPQDNVRQAAGLFTRPTCSLADARRGAS